MIKLLDLLKEVGESTAKPYKTIKRSDEIYEFTTSNGIVYFIELVENWTGQLVVSFRLKEDFDYAVTTNKGDMYKIMATVINEVKKYLNQHHHIDEIFIMPSKSNDSDSRRTNIYMAYIKKQMPKNWTVQLDHIGGEAGFDEIIMRKQVDN